MFQPDKKSDATPDDDRYLNELDDLEADQPAEEKPRLGREIKIGLGILGGLVGLLVIVLIARAVGGKKPSSGGEPAVAAQDAEKVETPAKPAPKPVVLSGKAGTRKHEFGERGRDVPPSPWGVAREEAGRAGPPAITPPLDAGDSKRFGGGLPPWAGNDAPAKATAQDRSDPFGRAPARLESDPFSRPAAKAAAPDTPSRPSLPPPKREDASLIVSNPLRTQERPAEPFGRAPSRPDRRRDPALEEAPRWGAEPDTRGARAVADRNDFGARPAGGFAEPAPRSPAAPAAGTYSVQQNENYWAISQKLYGTGDYYRALAEANAAKYPREDRLQPGDVIAAPPAAELARLYPTLVPKRSPPARPEVIPAADTRPGGRVYVVQQGDTLYDIARYQLGKASRWAEVYELNRDQIGQQYDNLPAGMQLVLPEASRAGRVTQYPGAGFER